VRLPNRLNICRTPSKDDPGDNAGGARVSVMDRRGNVTGCSNSGPGVPGSLNLPVDNSTNRLFGYDHDRLGNQLNIQLGEMTLNITYLDQGHIWETWSAPSGSGSGESMETLQYRYYYDAGGKRRIKAKASDGQTNFQEDASYYFYEGESLSCQLDIGELAPEEEEFYEPKFLMLDHLGSTRAEITFEGTGLTPTVSGRYDYMPYGQFINVPAEAAERVCFTGKPRDPESGLDIFGPRGLNSNLCRWMSPDQLFADNQPENQQSWNLYGYVFNNPIGRLDFSGTQGSGFESTYLIDGMEESKKTGIANKESTNQVLVVANSTQAPQQSDNSKLTRELTFTYGLFLTIGVIPAFWHIEANIGAAINFGDPFLSRIYIHEQDGFLFGLGGVATAGEQYGVGTNPSPTPGGGHEYQTLHLEGGIGKKASAGGSLDLGTDSKGEISSLSGAVGGRKGIGFGAYLAGMPIINRAFFSPTIKEKCNWVKGFF